MKPEAQRWAIAKAIGWKPATALQVPPDYPGDLNACHEMEKMLIAVEGFRAEQLSAYISHLSGVHSNPGMAMFACAHATAAQRAEAFLRVKGLWV